jgi:hypothetical protein
VEQKLCLVGGLKVVLSGAWWLLPGGDDTVEILHS